MTKEDIIRMAREAGFVDGVVDIMGFDGFANFAALVAAAELNRCVLILERLHERSGGQYNYYLHAAKVLKGEV
jgi:hypothetical protein